MAKIKTHIEDTIALLKHHDGWQDVHIWLDAYVTKYPIAKFQDFHRKFRHNAVGVEYIRKTMGYDASLAAKIHLIRDVEMFVLLKPMRQVKINELHKLTVMAYKYL